MTINLRADIAEPVPSLPRYEGITLAEVRIIQTLIHAQEALTALMKADVIGFDTESKPTFNKGELSDGPHLIQLATDDTVYLFPVGHFSHQSVLKPVFASTAVLKVGFGLSDDVKLLQTKCGISSAHVLDLSRALRSENRNDFGAKSAVAHFFGQRLQKSKKTSTSNWANSPLTERQILYAANDAQVALRIYRFWRKSG
ncbi:3'-5' exonuclease [Glaciimonas sp. GG7]